MAKITQNTVTDLLLGLVLKWGNGPAEHTYICENVDHVWDILLCSIAFCYLTPP